MGSSTGSLLLDDDAGLEEILGRISRRASFHAEDEGRLKERRHAQRAESPGSHPEWRDEETARLRDRAARAAGARRPESESMCCMSPPRPRSNCSVRHRDVASVEVTPHHLTLVAPDDYRRLGSLAQMNPPIRDARHQAAIWRAVGSGLVDVLGSDHAPHTREEKAKPYPASPSGAPGVQTLVPLMLDHVNQGRLTLERLVDLTSHGPARLFGIARKGRIAEGYDADLTVVDLKARRTITDQWIESRCGWTPYDGLTVTGWPVGTLVRGRRAMWEGTIAARAEGETVRFLESLPKE